MNGKSYILLLNIFFVFNYFLTHAQPPNNRCADAIELCPNSPTEGSNIGAASTFCPNCEDDFNFCFPGENTVWYYFQTNEQGGDAQVTISNMDFQQNNSTLDGLDAMIISADNPCQANTYTLVSNCEENINGIIQLVAEDLDSLSEYWVVINGHSDGNTNAEAEFEIELTGEGVEVNPFIFLSTPSGIICEGQILTLIVTIEDCSGQELIHWYKNGSLYATTSENSLAIESHQDGDEIRAEVFCADNCDKELQSNSITLNVHSFEIDAGEDLEILFGDTVRLDGFSEGTEIIFWEPTIHMINENTLNPFVSPTETTTYFLNASDGDCLLKDEVTVNVIKEFEVPNTFSPNGDGINDSWEIPGIEKFPDAFVQVYTRWGQLVFQTTGYNDPSKYWDGRSNRGRELTPGVYFYVINLRDERFPEPLKGHVTIVR